MEVATGPDGKLNVLPLNQDLFILYYNKELLAAEGLQRPPKTLDEMMAMAHAAHRSRRRASTASSAAA